MAYEVRVISALLAGWADGSAAQAFSCTVLYVE